MIRNARESDIPRLVEIRAAVRENQLRDASRVTFADYQWFIANPGIFVWEEGGRIVGFSAADPETEASGLSLWIKPTRDEESHSFCSNAHVRY